MPNKKPPATPSTAAKSPNRPPNQRQTTLRAVNARQQPDNRWQRTKRYGWDGR